MPGVGAVHALLKAIYKDPARPIAVRIAAAKIAIGYEKPKLAMTVPRLERPGELDGIE